MFKTIALCAEDIMDKSVSVRQVLGQCKINHQSTIEYLVTDKEINFVDDFDSMDTWSINHYIKAIEDRAKKEFWIEYGSSMPDHVICSVKLPTSSHYTTLWWRIISKISTEDISTSWVRLIPLLWGSTENHSTRRRGRILLLILTILIFHQRKKFSRKVLSLLNDLRPVQPSCHSTHCKMDTPN